MSATKTKTASTTSKVSKAVTLTAAQLKAFIAIPKGGVIETFTTTAGQARARVLDAKGVPVKVSVPRTAVDTAIVHGWLETTVGALSPDVRYKLSPKGRRATTSAAKAAGSA